MTSTARAALAGYRGLDARTRLHVLLRYATCPMDAIGALVPAEGRILDVGCGHGVMAIHLALSSPGRAVVGVDIDDGRVRCAELAAQRLEIGDRVTFEVVDGDWLPTVGAYDAIVAVDVLYLLAPAQCDRLLAGMVDALPSGRLVIKEMADRPRWKRAVTLAQETASVRLLHITSGAALNLHPTRRLVEPLVRSGAEVRTLRLDAGYAHPHLVIVADLAPTATDPALRSGHPG